jgi:uncharacterized membrane protein YkoI
MLQSSRKSLMAIATVSALAAGGAALAGAATNTTPSSSSSSTTTTQQPSVQAPPGGGPGGRGHGGPRGGGDQALTGTTAAKVKAAALDKVPGGTVLRTEKGGPYGSAYHAHVRKSDGSEVVVLVNASFEATSVAKDPAGSTGGPGRAHVPSGPRGDQTPLTGDTAAKVKAAALEKVPGGTVLRTEKGGHDRAAYHAHVRKPDGSEVVVLVDSSFEATSVETMPKRP